MAARAGTCSRCRTFGLGGASSAWRMPHGRPESWSTNVILQALRGLLHALCLEADFEFNIALGQSAFFNREWCVICPTSSSGTCTTIFVFLLIFLLLTTSSLLLSLSGLRGSSPLNFLIHLKVIEVSRERVVHVKFVMEFQGLGGEREEGGKSEMTSLSPRSPSFNFIADGKRGSHHLAGSLNASISVVATFFRQALLMSTKWRLR